MTKKSAVVAVFHDLWRFVSAGFKYYPPVPDNLSELDPGAHYDATDLVTNRMRLFLSGQYEPDQLNEPLQPSEYITYILTQAGITLPANAKYWEAGSWHQQLKGKSGVHIGITPKEGSVMEFFTADQKGRIAIIKNVTEDMTISCAGIGLYTTGVYDVGVWSAADWQEQRPVFINFS